MKIEIHDIDWVNRSFTVEIEENGYTVWNKVNMDSTSLGEFISNL